MEMVYLVDGVSLHAPDWGWVLEAQTKLPASANQQVTEVTAPFMDGAVRVPGRYETGEVAVSVAVHAGGADGLQKAVSALTGLLRGARNLSLDDRGTRRTVSVISAVVAEPRKVSFRDAVVTASFKVAPFWVEGVPRVGRGVPLRVGRVRLPEFDDATGKIVDGVIRLTGPFSMVELAGHHGGGLIVGGAERGESIFVDLHAWRSWKTGDPDAWEKPKETEFPEFPAGGRLELVPAFTGQMVTTSLEVKRAVGTGKESSLTVRGSRWWM